MKNLATLILLWAVSLNVHAKKEKKHEHREHEAHVHGSASLAIAFDQQKGRIEFKSPAESVVGFEHKAKSSQDQKILAETIAKFEGIEKMIQWDAALKCVFKKQKIEMQLETGNHADFIAQYDVECAKDVLGSSVKIDFTAFPKLKDLDVTILVGSLQKKAEATGQALTMELK